MHDERWVEAIETVGFDPLIFSLGRDASNVAELRSAVEAATERSTPILAGPLNSITRSLVGINGNLVGLSWGFDLHELNEVGDLGWLHRLDGLIVDSKATQVIAEAAGVPASRITMLPWGVDLEQFTPEGPQANLTQYGIPAGAQVVLSARAHEPLYRVADVIEGFAVIADQLPNAHLLITHEGSLTPELEQLAQKLGMSARIHFIGKVAEADLPSIMRASACYVSATSVDGTSVTLLQAMACRLPVVASDCPGNLGWVTDCDTGRTFPVGDTQKLALGLKDALNKSDLTLIDGAFALVQNDADWNVNISVLKQALTPTP